MKVRFKYDVEELVDIAVRGLRRRGIGLTWRWKDLLFSAACAGLMWYWLSPFTGWQRLAACGAIMLVVASCFPRIHRTLIRRRLRRMCLERMQGQKHGECEIELRPEGYFVKRLDVERLNSWDGVTGIADSKDAIEICTGTGDITVIKRNVFGSDEAYGAFFAEAKSFRSQYPEPINQ